MRIAVGGFQHETNTFAPEKATYAAFAAGASWPSLVAGAEMLTAVDGINLPITGAIATLRRQGHEPVPLAWAAASPSAQVTDEAFERIATLILAPLAAALPLDGVYLDLHGAMVTETYDDGEGELLRRVRAVVGDRVRIVASLDLHANVSAAMVERSDALVIYRTYPHVDMEETGARAIEHLLGLCAGTAGTAKAFRQLPFLVPMTWGCTLTEPAQSLYALVTRREGPGQRLSLAMGFPAADIPDCGPSVVAYAHTQAQAEALATEIADAVAAREPEFAGEALDAAAGVRQAITLAQGATRPIILADTQDNPGGGGNSDTVWILEELVRQRAPRAVVATLYDPAAAAAAHAAGVGATLPLAMGARSGQPGHQPYRGTVRVERLGDGAFTATGPMLRGARMQLGPTALLETGGVRVIVVSQKAQASDQSILRHVGLEPAEQAIIALKSSVHFRADFQPIAAAIVVVAAPGPMVLDPSRLPFRKLRAGVRRSPRDGRQFLTRSSDHRCVNDAESVR